MLGKSYNKIFYLILVFASFILYGHFLGDDIGPDLQNYQYFIGYQGLNQSRISTDVLPADIQSYFNPYYYSFYYLLKNNLSSEVVNAILSLIHSLNFIILFLISKKIVIFYKSKNINLISFLIALIGISNPFFLSMIGASWIDNVSPIFILLSLYFMINIFIYKPTELLKNPITSMLVSFFVPGVFLGISVGLKLTNFIFFFSACIGLLILFLSKDFKIKFLIKSLTFFGFGAFIGFIIINGEWMLNLYSKFKNPFFPFFNEFFKSEEIKHIFTNQPAWAAAQKITDYILMPFKWAMGIPNPSEWSFRDFNFAIMICAFFIWLFTFCDKFYSFLSCKIKFSNFIKKHSLSIFFVVWFVISFCFWLNQFGALRYFVSGSLTLGILIFIFIKNSTSNQSKLLSILVVTIIVSFLFGKTPPFGRLKWENAWHKNVILDQELVDNSFIYLTPGISIIFPFLNQKSIFLKFNQIEPEDNLFKKINDTLSKRIYPLRTISSWPWIEAYDDQLKLYGVKRDFTECINLYIKNVQEFQSCGVVDLNANIKVKYPFNVNFSSSHRPYIKSLQGLDSSYGDRINNKGNWSNTDNLQIHFYNELPKNLKLSLTGHAFNLNVESGFEVSIGSEIKKIFLTNETSTVDLIFNNISEGSNHIKIKIFNPISPKDLGESTDDRKLGIFLNSLQIDKLN